MEPKVVETKDVNFEKGGKSAMTHWNQNVIEFDSFDTRILIDYLEVSITAIRKTSEVTRMEEIM